MGGITAQTTMIQIMTKLIRKIQNNLSLILWLILSVVITIFLDPLALWVNRIPQAAIDGLVSINDRILFLTFMGLVWYAWETRRMKNEVVTQTELSLKPILVLFVRKCSTESEYRIQSSPNNQNFSLKVRNVGRGPAANLMVKSDAFVVDKYRNNTLAPEPKGDEQSIKIKRKDGTPVQDHSELNGTEFELSAQNFAEPSNRYYFVYRIIDVAKQEVEFVR